MAGYKPTYGNFHMFCRFFLKASLSKDLPCNDNNMCDFMGAHISKYHMVSQDGGKEVDMKELVYIAPVVTTIVATKALRHYEQGVLDDPDCCEKTRKTFQKMKI